MFITVGDLRRVIREWASGTNTGIDKSPLEMDRELRTMDRTKSLEDASCVVSHLDAPEEAEDAVGPVPPTSDGDPVLMLDPFVNDWLP
jgi:hypothetical protein